MSVNPVDILGYLGAVAVVSAYWLINRDKKINPYIIHALNFFGAFALGINSYYHGATPAVLINSIWVFIAMNATYREFKRKNAVAKN